MEQQVIHFDLAWAFAALEVITLGIMRILRLLDSASLTFCESKILRLSDSATLRC